MNNKVSGWMREKGEQNPTQQWKRERTGAEWGFGDLSSHWIWNDQFSSNRVDRTLRAICCMDLESDKTVSEIIYKPRLIRLCQLSVYIQQHLCSKCSFETPKTLPCKAGIRWIEPHYCTYMEGEGL